MKKLFVCLMAICLGVSLNVSAQSAYAKQKAKQAQKEYKQKVKKYTKEGWQVFNSSHTLEMALLNHYEALEGEGVREVTGYATSQSKNIGNNELRMRACEAYAQEVSGYVKGRVVDGLGSTLSTNEMEEFENFVSAYENNVQAEIKGEVRPSFAVYRQTTVNGKKVYEFEAYYLINEDAASKARIKAFERAKEESKLAHELAEETSKWINQPFEEK